mmetsp:Transcript_37674/g.106433  ORF Transcript_37674/g.106433 Transcript_37674/m.106433 type:complete len:211 (+) Transcript_37674:977-1609(+)
MKVTAFLWMGTSVHCSFWQVFSIKAGTKDSISSLSTACPYTWNASMHRLSTRLHCSSSPVRKSGRSSGAIVSLVTRSGWSSANWAMQLHAACRTRAWPERSCPRTALAICMTAASSSMYSAIWDSTVMPATTCFQLLLWISTVMAGFRTSNTMLNFSALFMQRQSRSMTSLPWVKFSSSSASSSTCPAQSSRSSSSSIRNWQLMSSVCWM